MTAADWVAVIMVIAITLYAWSGMADYGAGFWDLTAGGPNHGRRARALIDEVVTPIWEVNHVWLVFLLVTFWTGFGAAFGPVMTTLFVPFSLAALGIVLRERTSPSARMPLGPVRDTSPRGCSGSARSSRRSSSAPASPASWTAGCHPTAAATP